jgi:hypothetical protein
MIPGSFDDLKHRTVGKRLADLIAEWVALNAAYDSELSSVNKLRLKRQIDSYEKEIQDTEHELKGLELTPIRSHHHRQLHWDDHLPHIDFQRATKWFKHVIDDFPEEGGAAAFLIQNSNTMGGQWLLRRMTSFLDIPGETIDFKHYPIVFQPYEQLSPADFLTKIGQRVGIPPSSDNSYSSEIITRICQSLQSASVVFIEVEIRQNIAQREDFITWFLKDFWATLIRKWRQSSQQLPMIRMMVVIVAHSPVPTDCFSHLRCTYDQPDSEHLLELPLERWQEQDIRHWLFRYSGLTNPAIGITKAQIDQMAKHIYDISDNGLPLSVRNALLQVLEQGPWEAHQ